MYEGKWKNCLKTNSLDCGLQFTKVEKCSDLKMIPIFKAGDYLGFQLDLTKFEFPFEEYYTCFYTDLPLYSTKYPSQYGETKEGIHYPSFSCSPKFKKENIIIGLYQDTFLIRKEST